MFVNKTFETQPELLTPEETAALLRTTRSTIYDWKLRPEKYKIPNGLFIPFGRRILIRKDILLFWLTNRNTI